MERETGFEPATLSLGSCATAFAYVRGCIEISNLRPQASGDIHPCFGQSCGQNCGQTGRAALPLGCVKVAERIAREMTAGSNEAWEKMPVATNTVSIERPDGCLAAPFRRVLFS